MGWHCKKDHHCVCLTVQTLQIRHKHGRSAQVANNEKQALLLAAVAVLPIMYLTFIIFFPCWRQRMDGIQGPTVCPCHLLCQSTSRRPHSIHPHSPVPVSRLLPNEYGSQLIFLDCILSTRGSGFTTFCLVPATGARRLDDFSYCFNPLPQLAGEGKLTG